MKALVHTQPNTFELQDYDIPVVAEDEVLIQVKAVGICGSDVHGMTGKTGRRIPPVVMGHEASGIIQETGSGVQRYRKGDRVTFDSTIYCDRCSYCLEGRANLCESRVVLGVSCGEYRRHGAMAEYIAVPQAVLAKMPDGMSFQQAAMVEPVSIAYHGVARARVSLNATAAVVGCGIIGLFVLQVARLAGFGRIFAIDIDDRKLEKARDLGADVLINSGVQDAREEIEKHLGGKGVDVSFEAVGLSASVGTALSVVKRGGQAVLIGNWAPEISLPLQVVVTGEIDVLGSCASNRDFPVCVDLIASGRVDVDSLISATAPLEEGGRWFQTLLEAKELLYKVILEP